MSFEERVRAVQKARQERVEGSVRIIDTVVTDERAEDPEWVSWWREQTEAELEMLRPKVSDYGARDLEEIGRKMARMMGWRLDPAVVGRKTFTELGIFFYALGKMERWAQAIEEGREVSGDTLTDLGVYSRMALRVRESGGWPG